MFNERELYFETKAGGGAGSGGRWWKCKSGEAPLETVFSVCFLWGDRDFNHRTAAAINSFGLDR